MSWENVSASSDWPSSFDSGALDASSAPVRKTAAEKRKKQKSGKASGEVLSKDVVAKVPEKRSVVDDSAHGSSTMLESDSDAGFSDCDISDDDLDDGFEFKDAELASLFSGGKSKTKAAKGTSAKKAKTIKKSSLKASAQKLKKAQKSSAAS
eukprot:TRINITY_DN22416_c0_g1_i1.p1 TRINITY_DN22416_c0_g1~~TRINITY_DN22416_c0_g1_i1.p1  ORF type:complete len:152 (-),score=44.09 TRINITY_DN22416_c0_g1_i1:70-525(-)